MPVQRKPKAYLLTYQRSGADAPTHREIHLRMVRGFLRPRRVMQSVWILRSRRSPQALYRLLRQSVLADGQVFLLTEMSKNWIGYCGEQEMEAIEKFLD